MQLRRIAGIHAVIVPEAAEGRQAKMPIARMPDLVGSLIPCIDENGKPGLYDTVNWRCTTTWPLAPIFSAAHPSPSVRCCWCGKGAVA